MVEKNKGKSNPVAKHARTYNKANVFTDRKKRDRKGYDKHKGNLLKDDSLTTNSAAKKPINYTKPDGTKGVKMVPHDKDVQNEDLRKWFGKGKEGDWVRVGTDGEIKGDCAREPGEGKPKCMPRSKAHSMSTKDRASSARRKRHHDPDADRPGTGNKPIMVNTDKKESVQEKNVPSNPKLWAKFKSQAKSKFDVYPSAYANGWAAKQYKAAGGTWKSVSESNLLSNEENAIMEKDTKKLTPAELKKREEIAKAIERDQPDMPMDKKMAIATATAKRVDEVSKGLKGRYLTKAQMDAFKKVNRAYKHEPESPESKKHMASAMKRGRGMALAKKKMKEEVEQIDEASQKLIKKMQDLAGGPDKMPRGAEFRALKQRAQDELKKDSSKKKAAPAPKTTTKTAKGKTHTGSGDPADRNLIMQLRKAQDALSPEKFDILVSPTGKTVNLPKKQIDDLLKKHDSLGKPVDKRKFKIMLTKALRAKAK